MAKNVKFIQSYILLDNIKLSMEQQDELALVKKKYMLEFDELSTIDGRTMYYLVVRDENVIIDTIFTDDEGNETITYGLLTIFKDRNPEILGAWNYDGTPLGMTKEVVSATYSEEGEVENEEIITYSGISTYKFNKELYMSYMEDVIEYDEDDNIISTDRPLDAQPIRLFGGFNSPLM